MKKLPKMPEDLAYFIYRWVMGHKLRQNELDDIGSFYNNLGLGHSKNVLSYRGLSIGTQGFIKLMQSGKIKLKTRDSESWSCKINVARTFAKMGYTGIIMAKKIPENKVIIDLQKLLWIYQNSYMERDNHILGDYGRKMFRAIATSNECEMLTETICTKCDIKDVQEISLGFPQDAMIPYVTKFLSNFKLDRTAKNFLEENPPFDYFSFNNRVTLTRSGNKWSADIA